MNKYQKVMEHVKVDDEMKKRILQNVEKELSREGGVSDPSLTDKIVPFGKRLGDGIRQYAGIAAMFAILLVGAAAVVKMTGGVSNMSTSPAMSETATEAPAATESAEMAEAPAAEEAADEEAAEATYEDAEATYDSDSMAEAPATEEAAKPTYESETATEAPVATENAYEDEEAAVEPAPEPAGSAEKAEGTGKTEADTVNAPAVTEQPATSVEEAAPEHVSWVHYIAPILLPIILLAVIILIIWLIVRYFRRRK